ncbi:MAG: NAD-binding protein, partial [Firmicutes bacterium]|nr:NAD-binding protein [Bacillota bacterium]
MKSYIVIGLGKFGTEAAKRLCEYGCEVLAIDRNPELVQPISNLVTQAVVGDTRDKEVLRALGAKDFDCAIVSIGGSLADSVLATMNLK